TPAVLASSVAATPVCGFVTVIDAPGSTPPLASRTLPVLCPNVWADARPAASSKDTTTTHGTFPHINPPRCCDCADYSRRIGANRDESRQRELRLDRPRYTGPYTASPESSLNCPVLSPSFSAGTPRRLSIVSWRFVSGVCSGYTRWRPPLRVPPPPPTISVGSGRWGWRSRLLIAAP